MTKEVNPKHVKGLGYFYPFAEEPEGLAELETNAVVAQSCK